jgi:hypothetical protein
MIQNSGEHLDTPQGSSPMASMHRKQARLPILLPPELLEAVQQEAHQTDRNMCAVVRVALRHYFSSKGQTSDAA